MTRYTITPWRSQADLLRVRSQIYCSNPSTGDEEIETARRSAIDQIMAWKMRGNLPHAVESTALLTDALLHQQIPGNSSFSVRAVYSAAFTRFVTGFCDIGRNRERSLEPSSMLDIANKIGMPSHFVALRHEATHEEMPSLQRLLRATEEALDWLWNLYWSRLEEPESERDVAAALPEVRVQAKAILKTYRDAQLEALRSKKRSSKGDDPKRTAQACTAIFGSNRAKTDAFVNILVEDKLLCPSKREIGSSLDGAFMVWDELLQEIWNANQAFLRAMVEGLLRQISSMPAMNVNTDADKEAMCLWVAHIISSGAKADPSLETAMLQREVIEWCCMYPARWTHFLGTKLLQQASKSFRAGWEDLLAASQLGESVEVDDAPATDCAPWASVDEGSPMGLDIELGSWVRAVGPMQGPIGIVR